MLSQSTWLLSSPSQPMRWKSSAQVMLHLEFQRKISSVRCHGKSGIQTWIISTWTLKWTWGQELNVHLFSGKVELEKPLHLVIGSVTPTSVLLSWGTLLKTPYEGNVMNDCLEDGWAYTLTHTHAQLIHFEVWVWFKHVLSPFNATKQRQGDGTDTQVHCKKIIPYSAFSFHVHWLYCNSGKLGNRWWKDKSLALSLSHTHTHMVSGKTARTVNDSLKSLRLLSSGCWTACAHRCLWGESTHITYVTQFSSSHRNLKSHFGSIWWKTLSWFSWIIKR